MVQQSKELPRDIQSKLHDAADEAGEQVAMGTVLMIDYVGPENPHLKAYSECTCKRYSERKAKDKVFFWNEPDPDCEYLHLQPLPMSHVINLP